MLKLKRSNDLGEIAGAEWCSFIGTCETEKFVVRVALHGIGRVSQTRQKNHFFFFFYK